MTTYENLKAWEKAMELAAAFYEVSQRWPTAERFGLTAQVRRAAVSVPSNIAEGQGRASRADRMHFLHTARGSLFELQTQLKLAKRLDYTIHNDPLPLSNQTLRLINGLIRHYKQAP